MCEIANSCLITSPQPKAKAPTSSGFSIIELLILLAVIGILAGMGFILYNRVNARVTIESASTDVRQVILQARNRALASGITHRILLNSEKQIILQEDQALGWVNARVVDLPRGVLMTAPAVGSTIEFDTRGFAEFSPAGLVFRVSDGERTYDIAPAMSGNTRLQ